MDLRQLQYVVAVVDHGGFTKAAAALHVAQPSLSQAVRTLETELGVELFLRTGRSVVLTSAGEALLGPARQTLRDVETARAAVAAVVGLRAGRLDVVCLPTLARDPVAGIVGAFRVAHPDISVRLSEPDDAAAVTALVRTGEAEVGVTELPVTGSDLEAHPLSVQEYVAVLPPAQDRQTSNRAGGGSRRLPIERLAEHPLITTPPGTSTRQRLDEAMDRVGCTPAIAVETDHREAIGPLVAAGAGASLLPLPLAEEAALTGAVVRRVTPAVTRQVGLIHRAGTHSPAAAAFVQLAMTTAADSM